MHMVAASWTSTTATETTTAGTGRTSRTAVSSGLTFTYEIVNSEVQATSGSIKIASFNSRLTLAEGR